MIAFNEFLLNENQDKLAQQVGNLLTSLQNLKEDLSNLSRRSSDRATESIVNYIRRILHGRWDDNQTAILKVLQQIGVALMNAINTTTEDLSGIVVGSINMLQKVAEKTSQPLNEI